MKKPVHLLMAALLVPSSPALAGIREDVMAAMQRCSGVPDDRTWLDCTYGAQQLMRAKLGLPPAPQYQQRLVPPASSITEPATVSTVPRKIEPALMPRHRPGLLDLFTGNSEPVSVSTLVELRYDSEEAFIATLENGQVWRQVNVQPGYSKARLTLGSKVRVVRAALGSYDLQMDGDVHTYKVDRQS